METLKELEEHLEQISDTQSALIDDSGAAWVGKKKESRILGGR